LTIESLVAPGERIAACWASPRFEAELRRMCGLRGPGAGPASPQGIGYCGFDFRSYGYMQIGNAAAFFERIAPVDSALLSEYLAVAGLEAAHDTRRMKTAYQRALVLAIAAACRPEILVVERGGQFNEARPLALLREVVQRSPRAIVTYEEAAPDDAIFSRAFDARLETAALR
jgi:hypothetical protein